MGKLFLWVRFKHELRELALIVALRDAVRISQIAPAVLSFGFAELNTDFPDLHRLEKCSLVYITICLC